MPKYKFSDIAFNITEKRMPVPEDMETYIAPNNLETSTLSVPEFGYKVPLNGLKLVMHKGDVLFGRREPQLKHAAIAPHDGIFSAHGMIFHANPDVIDPDFFPFFIASDCFFDTAIRISVGSLSPTVNWKDLKNIEFTIPDMDVQKRYAKVLWAIIRAKRAYRDLINQTDELVKSQFIEMFEPYKNCVVSAGTVLNGMRNGVSPSKKGLHTEKVLTLSAVTQGDFDPTAWKEGTFDSCPPDDKRVSNTDFYICRGNGNRSLIGAGVISEKNYPELVFPDTVIAAHIDDTKILLPYLCAVWKQQNVRKQLEESARTTSGIYKINQSIIADIKILLPPLDSQRQFVTLVTQSDKSKFELKKALESLDAMQKAIVDGLFQCHM